MKRTRIMVGRVLAEPGAICAGGIPQDAYCEGNEPIRGVALEHPGIYRSSSGTKECKKGAEGNCVVRGMRGWKEGEKGIRMIRGLEG
jgi:hypothetical protein